MEHKAICPWCGEENDMDNEIDTRQDQDTLSDGDEIEAICCGCEKEFWVIVDIEVKFTFNTEKKEKEE